MSERAADDRATRGCVLLVDDEPAVLNIGERFLVLGGYSVLRADSSSAALAHFDARGSEIDLAVIDASMPSLSGPALLRELRARRAGLPALLTSGYSRAELDALDAGVEFLQKPFKLAEFLHAVDRLRGGPPRNGLT